MIVSGGCEERMPRGAIRCAIRCGIRSEQPVRDLARSARPEQDCFPY